MMFNQTSLHVNDSLLCRQKIKYVAKFCYFGHIINDNNTDDDDDDIKT